jgi:hypothetical protein
MRAFRFDLLTLTLCMCFVAPAVVTTQQSDDAPTDISVQSRLILAFRPVTLVYSPALTANEATHEALLSASGPTSSRVRVGQLRAHPLLRIGTLDGSELSGSSDESDDAEEQSRQGDRRYDLWLTRVDTGWTLEAQQPLSHSTTPNTAATLSAALVPTSSGTGQLVLAWGGNRWTADYDYADPPSNGRTVPAGGGASGELEFDSDTSAVALAVTLAERNETAFVLPDESRVSVLYWQEIGTEHDDFVGIDLADDGDVIRLTEAAVLRFKTDVSLRFGDVDVPTDNLAPDFPGSYGLWLKRVGDGWRLVFNNEPDAWGTQYNPEFDAAEIDLSYSQSGQATRPLGAVLIPTGQASATLEIHWGLHEWTADFTTGS